MNPPGAGLRGRRRQRARRHSAPAQHTRTAGTATSGPADQEPRQDAQAGRRVLLDNILPGLALAVLVGVTAVSLGRVYDDSEWIVPTAVTAAAALLSSTLLRLVRTGLAIALVGASAGFLVVTGNLLFAETLHWGLPGVATLTAMRAALDAALAGVVEQTAPVPVNREFLMLTCAGVWAVAVLADGLAFRARQPVLAVLPALCLFTVPALIRPVDPERHAVLLLVGVAAVLLAGTRPGSEDRPVQVAGTPGGRAGRWLHRTAGTRLVALAGVLALVGASALPGYGDPALLDHRTQVGTAGDVSINPFVSLLPNLEDRQETEVFTVRTQEPSYWRLLTLDEFDGTRWAPSDSTVTPGLDAARAAEMPPGAPRRRLTQTFTIQRLGGVWLPAAAVPVTVDAGSARVLSSARQAGVTVEQGWGGGFRYTAVSEVSAPGPADLRRPQDHSSPALAPYLELPDGIGDQLRPVAAEATGQATRPYDQALALQSWLRDPSRFTYDLDVPELAEGSGQPPLITFLTETRRGYCEQFAASMAALARTLGIPARVAVGFTPGTPVEGGYQVTAADAHAWPELYFTGVGWVRFEPTPRDDQVRDPDWAEPPVPPGVGSAPDTEVPAAPATTAPPPPEAVQPPEQNGRPVQEPAGTGTPERDRSPSLPVTVVTGLVVLGAAAAALVVVRRRWWTRPGPGTGVERVWSEFERRMAVLGLARQASETPAGYAGRVGARFPETRAELHRLAGMLEAAAYGPEGTITGTATAETSGSTGRTAAATVGTTGAEQEALRLATHVTERTGTVLGWRRRLHGRLLHSRLSALRP